MLYTKGVIQDIIGTEPAVRNILKKIKKTPSFINSKARLLQGVQVTFFLHQIQFLFFLKKDQPKVYLHHHLCLFFKRQQESRDVADHWRESKSVEITCEEEQVGNPDVFTKTLSSSVDV